jgi:hypothetical protein
VQLARQIIKIWTVIRVDDHRDGECAGVREDFKVDGHVSTLGNPNRNGRGDLVPAKHHRLCGTANMRHQRMESALVVHVEAVAAKPCGEPEHPTKNRDRRRACCCRFMGTHRCRNLSKAFANIAACGDGDEHRAH